MDMSRARQRAMSQATTDLFGPRDEGALMAPWAPARWFAQAGHRFGVSDDGRRRRCGVSAHGGWWVT